ncbi:hypothetical protein IHQ68_02400 [Chelatococcus sambhunathii]|uniref:Uncharacterized protein n=1 Tax=Chelatococcus sambhunathii TaxID=363953 RepID=A0ABU1DBR3_9HYPH|nr:hypothetical protein [Chelatococcus sambhunathii]MDR4305473.1 hypothetical protein [Chelatococcus sambhunathii]
MADDVDPGAEQRSQQRQLGGVLARRELDAVAIEQIGRVVGQILGEQLPVDASMQQFDQNPGFDMRGRALVDVNLMVGRLTALGELHDEAVDLQLEHDLVREIMGRQRLAILAPAKAERLAGGSLDVAALDARQPLSRADELRPGLSQAGWIAVDQSSPVQCRHVVLLLVLPGDPEVFKGGLEALGCKLVCAYRQIAQALPGGDIDRDVVKDNPGLSNDADNSMAPRLPARG